MKLTEHEIAERGESIASKMLRVKALRKKRREDLRSINAQIESELDNVQQIAETIMSGIEARKQSELFVGDEVVPSQTEATAALAEVVKHVQYHRDGAMCRKDPCKRRHLTPEQLDKAGVKREGAPLVDEDPSQLCTGCGADISGAAATERIKGMCEGCQTQPHEEVGLPSAEQIQASAAELLPGEKVDFEANEPAEEIAAEASADDAPAEA